ncbi:MAG TPA: lytic transglycosylase domain-containing protein [Marmoricola sp.]
MPKPKYVPKHRNAPEKPAARRHAAERPPLVNGAAIKNSVVLSGVAVAATGVAVSAGVFVDGGPMDNAAVALSASGAIKPMTAAELASREQQSSRSSDDRRAGAAKIKKVALSSSSGRAFSGSEDLSDADPKTLAKALMPQYGLLSSQFQCLDNIWEQESHWNVHADNPHSSAYGIPQALPGSKMSSAGPDWANSAETQIRWGLGYIKARYGSACSAWAFKAHHGWY